MSIDTESKRRMFTRRGTINGISIATFHGVLRIMAVAKPNGVRKATSFSLYMSDFYAQYARAVDFVCDAYGISHGSDLHKEMHARIRAYIRVYQIKIEQKIVNIATFTEGE